MVCSGKQFVLELKYQAWSEAWGAVLAVEFGVVRYDCEGQSAAPCQSLRAGVGSNSEGLGTLTAVVAATEAIYGACIPRGWWYGRYSPREKQLIEGKVDERSRSCAWVLRGPTKGDCLRGCKEVSAVSGPCG